MIKKTKDYSKFKFRDDNREKINAVHVQALIASIQSKNLLELRPICVNGNMEVIDGQHRLLAAKSLGVDIYYQEDESLQPKDVIKMNISKAWRIGDYLNFYWHHKYEEYKKLKTFMDENNLTLKVALNITMGQQHISYTQFKNGEFKFNVEDISSKIDICWETIEFIKRTNGHSPHTVSNRFWKALLRIVNHDKFDEAKWKVNIQKMPQNFGPKVSVDEYMNAFSNAYNYNSKNKINFMEPV
jgi:hypothetical protein